MALISAETSDSLLAPMMLLRDTELPFRTDPGAPGKQQEKEIGK